MNATSQTKLNLPLLKAIGVARLTEYFEFLDELRASGAENMFGAGRNLRDEYPGMAKQESYAVLSAWMDQSLTLPAEDRVCNVLDA